jgi:hypothetical protein
MQRKRKKNMRANCTSIAAAVALGFVAACGAEGGLAEGPASTSLQALTDGGQNALNEIAIINSNYAEASSSAECLALRAKVYSAAKAYKLTDAWRGLSGTKEYKAYEADQDHFAGAGCRDSSASSADACEKLRAKIDADGDAIANLAQFKAVDADGDFRNIMNDFDNAKTIGCVK